MIIDIQKVSNLANVVSVVVNKDKYGEIKMDFVYVFLVYSWHKDHTSEAVILRTTHRILRPDL